MIMILTVPMMNWVLGLMITCTEMVAGPLILSCVFLFWCGSLARCCQNEGVVIRHCECYYCSHVCWLRKVGPRDGQYDDDARDDEH